MSLKVKAFSNKTKKKQQQTKSNTKNASYSCYNKIMGIRSMRCSVKLVKNKKKKCSKHNKPIDNKKKSANKIPTMHDGFIHRHIQTKPVECSEVFRNNPCVQVKQTFKFKQSKQKKKSVK